MNTLIEKIEELLKAFGTLTPKTPQTLSMPKISTPNAAGRPRGPGVPRTSNPVPKVSAGGVPPSKKNPVDVAQQISNPDMKTAQIKAAKEGLAFNSRGQWALKKADEPHYHIEVNGEKITDKPLPLSHINYYHQGIKAIEKLPGHRVIPAEAPKES